MCRLYHQVHTWLGISLEPTISGWYLCVTGQWLIFKPYNRNQIPTPSALPKKIMCNGSGRCGSNMCGCRYNVITCYLVCGQSKGTTCCNVSIDDSTDVPDTSRHILVEMVTNKLSKITGILNKLKFIYTHNILLTIYNYLFVSHINY